MPPTGRWSAAGGSLATNSISSSGSRQISASPSRTRPRFASACRSPGCRRSRHTARQHPPFLLRASKRVAWSGGARNAALPALDRSGMAASACSGVQDNSAVRTVLGWTAGGRQHSLRAQQALVDQRPGSMIASPRGGRRCPAAARVEGRVRRAISACDFGAG